MPNKQVIASLFFAVTVAACKKDSNITNQSSPGSNNQVSTVDTDSSIAHLNTPLLTGNHDWRGYQTNLCMGMAYTPFYFLHDTTFSIQVINDSTLSIHSYTLKRVSKYNAYPEDSTTYLFFVDSSTSQSYYMPAIVYKHNVDSVWFYFRAGACGYLKYVTKL